jgi:hypothetical protein
VRRPLLVKRSQGGRDHISDVEELAGVLANITRVLSSKRYPLRPPQSPPARQCPCVGVTPTLIPSTIEQSAVAHSLTRAFTPIQGVCVIEMATGGSGLFLFPSGFSRNGPQAAPAPRSQRRTTLTVV